MTQWSFIWHLSTQRRILKMVDLTLTMLTKFRLFWQVKRKTALIIRELQCCTGRDIDNVFRQLPNHQHLLLVRLFVRWSVGRSRSCWAIDPSSSIQQHPAHPSSTPLPFPSPDVATFSRWSAIIQLLFG